MIARIPRGSFGLVCVDGFESEPGEELYLVEVFSTREEAGSALSACEGRQSGRANWVSSRFHIYEGEGEP